MELALLVWVISILGPVTHLLGWIAAFLTVIFVVMLAALIDGASLKAYWYWIIGTTIIVLITTATLLPSERTAYLMVGAYAAQRVAEDPKVQQISGKVLKAIELKIDGYIEEASKEINPAPIDKKWT